MAKRVELTLTFTTMLIKLKFVVIKRSAKPEHGLPSLVLRKCHNDANEVANFG